MICERTYMIPALAPERVTTPHRLMLDACPECHGTGFYPSTLSHPEGVACPDCDGIATTGTYVVQTVTARFHHEQNFQTQSLAHALRRAHRTAVLFAGRKCLGWKVLSVRIVFKQTPFRAGGSVIRCDDETVVSIPVGVSAPVAA